jgi:hypothetical protein
VLLAVAGCSSGSDGGKDDADGARSDAPSAQPSPTVAPAKYSTLPDACKTIGGKTIGELVPSAKTKGGTSGTSSDIATHGSCSWNGLKDNGVKGSQYRWIDVSLMRYDSQASIGSGAAQAGKHFSEEVANAQATQDARSVITTPASGVGEQATIVTYTLRKTDADFSYATVVARADNVVVTLTYNGAGYSGAKSPSTSDMSKDAVTAAKEAVASIENGGNTAGGSDSSSGSGSSGSGSSGSGSGSSKGSGKGSDSGSGVGHAPSRPGSSSTPGAPSPSKSGDTAPSGDSSKSPSSKESMAG